MGARLSEAEKRALREKGAALAAAMEKPDSSEDIAKLPRLGRADLKREVETIARNHAQSGGIDTLVHPLFTNGIVYLDLAFPLERLTKESLLWLPLASRFFTSAGLPGESYDLVSQRLARAAGGFHAMLESGTPLGAESASSYAIFRLKALASRFPSALEIMMRLLTEADSSDFRRVEDLCAELRNDVASAIVPAGNSFAQTRAASGFGEASAIEDLWRGTSQVEFLIGLKDAKGEKSSPAPWRDSPPPSSRARGCA